MTPKPKATDVAKRAGVSQTAVSFVLNGRAQGNVSEATRDKILSAAEELGYQPNEVARSLRSNRTMTLGLVTDSIASSTFAGRLLAGATELAANHGYAVIVIDYHDHRERELAAFAELRRRQVDGLIYASMAFRELSTIPSGSKPVVLANCTGRTTSETSVIPDDPGGAATAARHLLSLGHRDLAMISGTYGPETHESNISAPLRSESFRHTATGNARSIKIVEAGWDIKDGYEAAMGLLSAPDKPTAIFAINDRVATGTLLAAARLGIRVPDDLSIVGFDDQEHLASEVVPALTTVALPHSQMGEMAVKLSLEIMADPEFTPQQIVLTCPLVERASTSRPATR